MSLKTLKLDVNKESRNTPYYFYLMSMLTSFLNFLYYPVLSRILPIDLYGEVQFIVTILFQVSVLFLALNIITVLVSIRYSKSPPVLAKKIIALSSALNISTAALTLVLVIVSSFFHQELGFNSPLAFIVMGIAILSTVPFTLTIGLLQGKNLYIRAATLNVIGSGLKLIFSVLFVLTGMGAVGAILGIAVGQFIAVIIFILNKKNSLSFSDTFSFTSNWGHRLKPDWLLILSCVWIIAVNILMSLDTILAKSTLNPEQAGEYAGIATLSKIAIFAVSPLMWLVIPSAAEFREKGKTVKILLLVALAFCASLVSLYLLFGDSVLLIVVGDQYLVMSNLLVLATIGSSLLSISAMMGVILIARQLYRHSALQAISMIAIFLTVFIYYSQSNDPLLAVLLAQAISGGVGVIYYSIIAYVRQVRK